MGATVVSGFPGVGKSYLFDHAGELTILDSDSSQFSWREPGIYNTRFPINYMEHIQANKDTCDLLLVSSHGVVRNALIKAQIKFTIVYPSVEMKEEFIQRYLERGSTVGFIELVSQMWEEWISEIEAIDSEFVTKIKLEPGQYLKDRLDELI